LIKTFATGGLGDLFFVFGATPDEVTIGYQKIVGKPVLSPTWALGWHQSEFGYHDTAALNNSVTKYSDFDLPLDG